MRFVETPIFTKIITRLLDDGGGLRGIYYWAPTESAFYMLYGYSKNEQDDLTPTQARMLGQLVREEFK